MRKTFLATALVVTMLVPQGLIAQGVCTVKALDTVAGIGTQITLTDCPSGMVQVEDAMGGANIYNAAASNGTSVVVSIPASDTQMAGTYSVSMGSARATFMVLADAPDANASRLFSNGDRISVGTQGEGAVVTLTLQDRFGNPLSGRPVALLSNRQDDQVVPAGVQTDTNGEMRWQVRAQTAGAITLTAYDILSSTVINDRITLVAGGGSIPSSNFNAAVTPFGRGGEFGVVDHFELVILDEGAIRANQDLSIRITALDSANNVVEDYTGTLHMTSTDPEAILPGRGNVTFRPAELGSKEISLGMRFRTPGEQTLTATDDSDASVRGSVTVTVARTNGDSGGDIVIMDPPNGSHIREPSVFLQGKGPSLINVRVKGGAEEVTGDTDAEGVFRITVPLNAGQVDHTLFVVSDNGRYESAAHHLVLDNDGPAVESISFSPEIGQATTEGTITVLSEPKLKSVTAELGRETLTLSETQSGTYVSKFSTPEPKSYDVKVIATDGADNATTVFAKWNVEGKGLPVVEGVVAEGRPNAILVGWQPSTDPDVKQYRIYVGSNPQNFEYGLNTASLNPSALVNGLTPGATYYIAVTALNGENEESVEKSQIVTASPLGMSLTVKPGNESVLLEWAPPANTPLATYILEYGVDAGVYSEQRKISGDLRAYSLRDLINGVTYEIKLTPVTVTGQRIDELATIVHGTPNGTGFGVGPSDPAPNMPQIEDPTHGGAPVKPYVPPNVPSTPGSGIPPFALWGTITLAFILGVGMYRYRRQRKLLMQFMAAMDHQYRSH